MTVHTVQTNPAAAAQPGLAEIMAEVGAAARAATVPLALAAADRKHAALVAMADAIMRDTDAIRSMSPKPRSRVLRARFSIGCNSTKNASPPWPTASARSPKCVIRSVT
jgi:hypothetical protein